MNLSTKWSLRLHEPTSAYISWAQTLSSIDVHGNNSLQDSSCLWRHQAHRSPALWPCSSGQSGFGQDQAPRGISHCGQRCITSPWARPNLRLSLLGGCVLHGMLCWSTTCTRSMFAICDTMIAISGHDLAHASLLFLTPHAHGTIPQMC